MKTIALKGRGGGKISTLGGVLIEILSKSTPRVQELYLPIYHYLCQQVEQRVSNLILHLCP